MLRQLLSFDSTVMHPTSVIHTSPHRCLPVFSFCHARCSRSSEESLRTRNWSIQKQVPSQDMYNVPVGPLCKFRNPVFYYCCYISTKFEAISWFSDHFDPFAQQCRLAQWFDRDIIQRGQECDLVSRCLAGSRRTRPTPTRRSRASP